jgi:hypothetical protein
MGYSPCIIPAKDETSGGAGGGTVMPIQGVVNVAGVVIVWAAAYPGRAGSPVTPVVGGAGSDAADHG